MSHAFEKPLSRLCLYVLQAANPLAAVPNRLERYEVPDAPLGKDFIRVSYLTADIR